MNANNVFLIGHATRDPEVRTVGSSTVATFRLAVNRSYKKGDEWIEKPTFVDCDAWAQRADYVKSRVQKGTEVFVRGRLESDEWEKDGERRSKLKVYVLELQTGKNKRGGDDRVAPAGGGSSEDDFPF